MITLQNIILRLFVKILIFLRFYSPHLLLKIFHYAFPWFQKDVLNYNTKQFLHTSKYILLISSWIIIERLSFDTSSDWIKLIFKLLSHKIVKWTILYIIQSIKTRFLEPVSVLHAQNKIESHDLNTTHFDEL